MSDGSFGFGVVKVLEAIRTSMKQDGASVPIRK
jgi:hypothetical protein